MYHIFEVERLKPLSRLSALPRMAIIIITIALARPFLEAVEWLLTARNTWIAVLPMDIQRYVLRPYLWIRHRLCDIPHCDGFIYGVPNGRLQIRKGLLVHFRWGIEHRIGAPAVEGNDHYIYYQNGRPFRESGPFRVELNRLVFSVESPVVEVYHCFDQHIHFRSTKCVQGSENKYWRCVSLHLLGSGRLKIRWRMLKTRSNGCVWMLRIFSDKIVLKRDDKTIVIRTDMFRDLISDMLAYMLDFDAIGRCAREWARAKAEIANA